MWLNDELFSVFGVEEKLCGESAQRVYDQIEASWRRPSSGRGALRAVQHRGDVHDRLRDRPACPSQTLRQSGWKGGSCRASARRRGEHRRPNWHKNIDALGKVGGIEVTSYMAWIEPWRTDGRSSRAWGHLHRPRAMTAYTGELSDAGRRRSPAGDERRGHDEDATRFTGHMLMQMAA